MKKIKFLGFLAPALLCVSFASAQDFSSDFDFSDSSSSGDFGSDFGNDFSGDFGSSSSSSSFSGFSSSALEVSGEAEVNFRGYFDKEDEFGVPLKEWETEADPKGKINLKYANDAVSAEVKFALSKDILDEYHGDVVDELTLESYLGNFVVQAGKMKVVWGKGDKLHAVDNFNANDYTDFINDDYIDRRLAEPMVRVLYNVPNDIGPFSSSRFEAVWTPFMTADRYALSGRWVPAQVKSLESKLTGLAETDIAETITKLETVRAAIAKSSNEDDIKTYQKTLASLNSTYLHQLSNSSSLADNLYPDTNQLKYMQAGARFTTTTGSLDWGLSYYIGRNKRASFDYKKMESFVSTYLTTGDADDDDKFIDYDFLQVFGLEAAKTFGAYNFRAEAAYNLTKDTAGDDPTIQNNSIAWVAGFDRDLPISELNVNIQGQGKHILHHDKIDDNGENDTEDGSFANDVKIVLNISDSWNHGKVKPEVSAVYGIQHYDLVVMPKITWYVSDGLEFSAKGMYMASYKSDKTEFEGWHNNGFVQFGAKYTF